MTARVLADISRMAWPDVLKLRRIGGSDAPTVAGVSPFGGPVELWARMTGTIPPVDETEEMRWGTLLEGPIRDEFGHRNGLRVTKSHRLLLHAEHDFATCLLDGQVVVKGDGLIPLQVKTGGHFADGWTDDEIPANYMVQVQHELAVVGAPYGYVAALLGGRRYHDYRVDRDDTLIDRLMELEAEFWQHVQDRTMPATDGRSGTRDVFGALWEQLNGTAVDLPDSALYWRDEYRAGHAAAAAGDERKARAGNELVRLLGEADGEVGFVAGEKVASWRRPVPKTPRFDEADFKATSPHLHATYTRLPAPDSMSRRLTVHKPKGATA